MDDTHASLQGAQHSPDRHVQATSAPAPGPTAMPQGQAQAMPTPTAFDPALARAYALAALPLQGYALDDAATERVAAVFEQLARVATPLLALELPAELDPAPVYSP